MVRHRKLASKASSSTESASTPGPGEASVTVRTFQFLSVWKTGIGVACFLVAVYISVLGYLETRVNTPFDDNRVVKETGLDVPDKYWGSYRPGVYFGLKTREPRSPVFGLMWYELSAASHKGIRHWCYQSDNLATYGWLRHDGISFGEQMISDPPIEIVTSFVKTQGGRHGGHWTARINVTSKVPTKSPVALVWYGALDETMGPAVTHSRIWLEKGALYGQTTHLHNFRIKFVPQQGKILHMSYSEAHAEGLNLLKEKFHTLLTVERHSTLGKIAVLGLDEDLKVEGNEVNYIPIQMLVETPFTLDVVYSTEELPAPPLQGEEYSRALDQKKRAFDLRFEEMFNLSEKGYPEEDVNVAKAALSNMLGGIGYFYGAGRVQSQFTKEPVPYWRSPLYTGVPSRSFFPRGFLWDEGFHGLLLARWSPDIQLDIAAHWMDLVNVEGWIPREQILGPEALARVPKEFVVQSNAAANPPILLLQLAKLVRARPTLFDEKGRYRELLNRMFPRLQAWYQYFQTTQKGDEPTTFRWRGRDDDGVQLNAKTLSSGFDDYPRASHPTSAERHVDLRCWMHGAADAMAVIAATLNKDTSKFEDVRDQLGDENLLNELHWSPESETYADYGLHTDAVKLVRQPPRHPSEQSQVVRVVSAPPQLGYVTSSFGYVSLFPLLMKILRPDSDKLGKMLEKLDKPDLLWSPFGLRSLSKSCPMYMKRNTEHDPPYWRGQIWMNINYLALSSLKHYGEIGGPYAERARELHSRLRHNLVRNIISEYRRTGYLWEQYSGDDGRGSGSHPFTGWTGLLVLVMADEY